MAMDYFKHESADLFLGPLCILTNVTNPWSQAERHNLYEKSSVKKGCSIGANATVVCGVAGGRYAFVVAGAVITEDVPDYVQMMGTPARQKGRRSHHGHCLKFQPDGLAAYPENCLRYRLDHDHVRCIDLDEDARLPQNLACGTKNFHEFNQSCLKTRGDLYKSASVCMF
jgi:UDP-2-acetamido-3-amino-2,3-dideoxy-glucuronate N-acetyltransferase